MEEFVKSKEAWQKEEWWKSMITKSSNAPVPASELLPAMSSSTFKQRKNEPGFVEGRIIDDGYFVCNKSSLSGDAKARSRLLRKLSAEISSLVGLGFPATFCVLFDTVW